MTKRMLVLAMGALLVSGVVFGAEPKVEVRGVRVVGDGYGGKRGTELRPFNWSKGTAVVLFVTGAEGGLLEFDDDASELKTFEDDRGTDLLKAAKDARFGRKPGFGHFSKVSKDGKVSMVDVSSTGLPADGATKLKLAGKLAFRSATTRETYEQKGVALKKDTKINFETLPMTVQKVGKPKWGNDALAVTLETNADPAPIADVKFIGADGKEIESRIRSRTHFGNTYRHTYNLKKKADTVTVQIEYWTDMKTVDVPFSVEATLGL
ncbi:MAG: hypothetical protein ACOC8E_01405 [Planctomycetota bacterium]